MEEDNYHTEAKGHDVLNIRAGDNGNVGKFVGIANALPYLEQRQTRRPADALIEGVSRPRDRGNRRPTIPKS